MRSQKDHFAYWVSFSSAGWLAGKVTYLLLSGTIPGFPLITSNKNVVVGLLSAGLTSCQLLRKEAQRESKKGLQKGHSAEFAWVRLKLF